MSQLKIVTCTCFIESTSEHPWLLYFFCVSECNKSGKYFRKYWQPWRNSRCINANCSLWQGKNVCIVSSVVMSLSQLIFMTWHLLSHCYTAVNVDLIWTQTKCQMHLPLVKVQMKISLLVSSNRYICVSFATCINFFLCQDVWLFSIKLILVKTSLWLLFVLYVSFAIKDNHQLSSLMSCQCYDCYLSVEKIRAWKISFNNRKLDGETSSLREELSLL